MTSYLAVCLNLHHQVPMTEGRVIRPTDDEVDKGLIHLAYCCCSDQYIRVSEASRIFTGEHHHGSTTSIDCIELYFHDCCHRFPIDGVSLRKCQTFRGLRTQVCVHRSRVAQTGIHIVELRLPRSLPQLLSMFEILHVLAMYCRVRKRDHKGADRSE